MLRVKPPRHAHLQLSALSPPYHGGGLHRHRDAPARTRHVAHAAWAVKLKPSWRQGSWVANHHGDPVTTDHTLPSPFSVLLTRVMTLPQDWGHDWGPIIGSCLLLRSCLSITGACDVCERGLDVRL